VIAEVAERGSIKEFADNFNLDAESIRGALEDVAVLFDHPLWEKRLKIQTDPANIEV